MRIIIIQKRTGLYNSNFQTCWDAGQEVNQNRMPWQANPLFDLYSVEYNAKRRFNVYISFSLTALSKRLGTEDPNKILLHSCLIYDFVCIRPCSLTALYFALPNGLDCSEANLIPALFQLKARLCTECGVMLFCWNKQCKWVYIYKNNIDAVYQFEHWISCLQLNIGQMDLLITALFI